VINVQNEFQVSGFNCSPNPKFETSRKLKSPEVRNLKRGM
jgi:hypothetical protein